MADQRAPHDSGWSSRIGDLLLDLRDGRATTTPPAGSPSSQRRYTVLGRQSVGTGVPAVPPAAAGRRGTFRALDIPADSARSCYLLTLTASSVSLGEPSSSHLESIHASTVEGAGYCVYLFRDRAEQELPNRRLALLGARLGWPELPPTAFTGGALITGTGPGMADVDVPIGILTAALRAQLLPRPRQSREAGTAHPSLVGESPLAEAGGPLVMEVVTLAGRAAPVEFLITGAEVEIWHHEGAAVVSREVLRGWLARPTTPLVLGSAIFCLDRGSHPQGQVAITLPDVGVWTMPPRLLHQLRSQV